jgi:transposase
MGIDIGKNSFHVVGLDQRGAIVLRQRGQVEARLANMPPCLIGMEACVGAHHLSRKLQSLGHDARLMPAKDVKAYVKRTPQHVRAGGSFRRKRASGRDRAGGGAGPGRQVQEPARPWLLVAHLELLNAACLTEAVLSAPGC